MKGHTYSKRRPFVPVRVACARVAVHLNDQRALNAPFHSATKQTGLPSWLLHWTRATRARFDQRQRSLGVARLPAMYHAACMRRHGAEFRP